MMIKHTPEPWAHAPEGMIVSLAPDTQPEDAVVANIKPKDASRIVTCVNACAGMTDPEAEIAELKRQRDELLAVLGSAIPLIKQARLDWCDQNSKSYDEDAVTPYDAILYSPVILLLETKGSAL